MRVPSYDNQLLNLAEDLARRLLPAFDTPTGITQSYTIMLVFSKFPLIIIFLTPERIELHVFIIQYIIFEILTFDRILYHHTSIINYELQKMAESH